MKLKIAGRKAPLLNGNVVCPFKQGETVVLLDASTEFRVAVVSAVGQTGILLSWDSGARLVPLEEARRCVLVRSRLHELRSALLSFDRSVEEDSDESGNDAEAFDRSVEEDSDVCSHRYDPGDMVVVRLKRRLRERRGCRFVRRTVGEAGGDYTGYLGRVSAKRLRKAGPDRYRVSLMLTGEADGDMRKRDPETAAFYTLANNRKVDGADYLLPYTLSVRDVELMSTGTIRWMP